MKLLDDYIEKLLNESTPDAPMWNIEAIHQGKKPAWNYVDGCMMTSLLSLYDETKNESYLNFVQSFMDYYVANDGAMLRYDMQTFNLDDICESRVLFDLYFYTHNLKYAFAIEKTYAHILNQPRTKEGSFWHKLIYPNQVWLDGLFMAQPFYMRYSTMNQLYSNYEDIIHQFQMVRTHMFDPQKQLYYHGYDASKQIFWANKETGLSKNFWLRSSGWFVVSIIDTLSYVEPSYRAHIAFLRKLLKEAIDGLLRYQDEKTHLFYQVIDQKDRKGNYLESSGASLICYAILKGVRLGALPHSYLNIGKQLFESIIDRFVKEKDGKLSMDGICLVAGLGPENNIRRDGSFEYYISEPIVENDAKGVGPLVMAYSEYKKVKGTH